MESPLSGSAGLYRNGVLIGAIGISGDAVDQNDIVAAAGTHDFLAPNAIRSDQFNFRGTRLPCMKFPSGSGTLRSTLSSVRLDPLAQDKLAER